MPRDTSPGWMTPLRMTVFESAPDDVETTGRA